MSSSEDRNIIKEHFRLDLPGYDATCELYLLLCNGGGVTVRSQQMRAMNLAWALQEKLQEKANVAVIGGGAAGITFAAAAAKLGAKVKLFETSKLMHLQVGSWHRPLHPEIYTWPEDTAFRPVSHMPMLGWTTGRAHEVATEIVGKFRVLERELGKLLEVNEGKRATLTGDGHLKVNGSEYRRKMQIIVLAVGFGIEETPSDLPLNSYWRADALDQSFLGDDKPTVVVSGAGDGALIDIMRALLQETDQGHFLDKILAVTLRDQKLRHRIKEIEESGGQVSKGYLELDQRDYKSLEEIDFLLIKKPNIAVKWLYRSKDPFDSPALPINRFLVSRLIKGSEQSHLDLKLYSCADKLSVARLKKGEYRVGYKTNRVKQKPILCQQAVCRWGVKKYESRVQPTVKKYPDLLWSAASVFEQPTPELLQNLEKHFTKSKNDNHENCKIPSSWENDAAFKESLTPGPSKRPRLMAEFVMAFDSPDLLRADSPKIVYRIRIWLLDVCKYIRVKYDLHPEENNKPISRVGIGEWHEQWLNTRNDYSIRVRTSDGFEWHVGYVLEALRRRYVLPKKKDKKYGADPHARAGVKIKRRQKDGTFKEEGSEQSWKEAIMLLDEQTHHQASTGT